MTFEKILLGIFLFNFCINDYIMTNFKSHNVYAWLIKIIFFKYTK